jgi:hypothetical protein
MNKVTVHRFKIYDISNDEWKVSRRWATQEGIDRVCGERIDGTATEIDSELVDSEVPGMTAKNYDPNAFSSGMSMK